MEDDAPNGFGIDTPVYLNSQNHSRRRNIHEDKSHS